MVPQKPQNLAPRHMWLCQCVPAGQWTWGWYTHAQIEVACRNRHQNHPDIGGQILWQFVLLFLNNPEKSAFFSPLEVCYYWGYIHSSFFLLMTAQEEMRPHSRVWPPTSIQSILCSETPSGMQSNCSFSRGTTKWAKQRDCGMESCLIIALKNTAQPRGKTSERGRDYDNDLTMVYCSLLLKPIKYCTLEVFWELIRPGPRLWKWERLGRDILLARVLNEVE